MAWTDDLELQVKEDLKKKSSGTDRPARRNAGNRDLSVYWLFGIILLLVTGVAVTYQAKGGNPYVAQPYNNYQSYNPYPSTPAPNYNSPYDYNYPSMTVDQRMERLESAARKIWDRTKWNSDRLTLLATINNHNGVVIKNALPRQELILLNSDWTINRMPDRIQLDQQDQEFLKQYIRK